MPTRRAHPHISALISIVVLSLFAASACKRPQDDHSEHPTESASENQQTPSGSAESEGTSATGSEAECAPPDVEGVGARDLVPGETFEHPVYLTQPPGDSETLYVVERAGRILRVRDGSILEKPFLDIRDRVGTRHQERGLLGLAFHPDYPENGRFFIYYTPVDEHKNVVAEYRRADDGTVASPKEVRRLVEVRDPEDNHNGGMLTFGPDGHLYAGMGDGGGAGDRHGSIGNGQNKSNLLGSIVRLDVDAPERGYAPSDNPFVGADAEGADRIWAWGLRNPWRFSFDSKTGDLYIGDVGQNKIEEIDLQPAESEGGENYGWRAYEGDEVYDRALAEKVDDAVKPIVSIRHGLDEAPVRGACSVTGGYVYRGDRLEGLEGAYLYGDYCSDDVAALRHCGDAVAEPRRIPGLVGLGDGLGSFGRDNAGALYLLYHESGDIKKITPK